MPHRLAWALLAAAALLLLACSDPPRAETADGEPCGSRDECRHGYCIAIGDGDETVCTRSCATTEECPRGWSCSGITDDGVVVCVRGAANPFGIGARE